MTRLDWAATGNRFYESGVDRGVLYLYGSGFAWPGLISVDESPVGGASKALYYDGVKYNNRSLVEEFEATISAYASPPEFAACDGSPSVRNGLFAGNQPRAPFSMSYRTMVGNDLDDEDAYKIHLIYNALTVPANKTYSSGSNNPSAMPLRWKITTMAPGMTGMKPTSHFFVDSRYTDPAVLTQLENQLYGTDTVDPSLPSVTDLMAMFGETIYDSQFPATPTTQILDGGTP